MFEKQNWFIFALIGMLSFACMALSLKKLTYNLPTSVILLYLFAFTTPAYLIYNVTTGTPLDINWTALLFLLLASVFAFIGNLCDVEALRLAPNAGYAAAIKSGQIIVITMMAFLLFKDQKITVSGLIGVALIFCGVFLLSYQR
ncbi:MAG: DMT family transporter [Desulfobacterales bacterium]|nr:DMT family transporter [Desulfobacterales bacterium]